MSSTCLEVGRSVSKPKNASCRASHKSKKHTHGHMDRPLSRDMLLRQAHQGWASPYKQKLDLAPQHTSRLAGQVYRKKDLLPLLVMPAPKHKDCHPPVVHECGAALCGTDVSAYRTHHDQGCASTISVNHQNSLQAGAYSDLHGTRGYLPPIAAVFPLLWAIPCEGYFYTGR